MTTSPEPNITAVVSIIAALIAAAPPALTTIADITIKLRGLLQEKKSPPPRVIKIIREPVDRRYWIKIKRNCKIGVSLLVISIIFLFVNTLLYRFGFNYITLSDFGVIGRLWGFKINIIIILIKLKIYLHCVYTYF